MINCGQDTASKQALTKFVVADLLHHQQYAASASLAMEIIHVPRELRSGLFGWMNALNFVENSES